MKNLVEIMDIEIVAIDMATPKCLKIFKIKNKRSK